MARIAEFGHGTRTELVPAEAINIALSAPPAPLPATGLAHPAIGAPVQVLVDEFGTEVIDGTLAHIDDTRIILHWDTPQVGTVAVHFPRHGYPLRTTLAPMIALHARYIAVVRIQITNRIIRAAFFTTDRIVRGVGASGDCKCQSYKRDLS